MDLLFKQMFGAQHSGQAVQPWHLPCASLVLGLPAATLSLELLLHPSPALLIHTEQATTAPVLLRVSSKPQLL